VQILILKELESKLSGEDIDKFARNTINDPGMRFQLVNLMLNHEKIMIYYNSYYIISKACEIRPDLFYEYWDDFKSLLNHSNSYHRDFALKLLAIMVEVDDENRFSTVFNEYFSHINDEKFMTASKCIENTAKILSGKKELIDDIVKILLNVDNLADFPEKQKALLNSYIIQIFDEFYEQINDKKDVNRFVEHELNSISPKTRENAKKFVKNHC
jgi:hypothetical protein